MRRFDRPISFQLDVMAAVLLRGGCNTGSLPWRGPWQGRFSAVACSVFDPQGDYYRITREIGTRRINLASPADSLLIEKDDWRGAAHRRKAVLRLTASIARRCCDGWKAGAPKRCQGRRRSWWGVDLYPSAAVLEGEGATQQFIARARYADGTDRDNHQTSRRSCRTNDKPPRRSRLMGY